MKFEDIPIRTNTQLIDESWFNSLREAGIAVGGQGKTVTTLTVADDGITVTSGFYLADASGGTFEIILPPAADQEIVTIKKIDGNNNIIVSRNSGAEKIDGVPSFITLSIKNEAVTIISDGTDHYRI